MSTVHVVPVGDLVEHEVPEVEDGDDLTCACGPHAECVRRADLPDGWVITHHSLDGREHRE